MFDHIRLMGVEKIFFLYLYVEVFSKQVCIVRRLMHKRYVGRNLWEKNKDRRNLWGRKVQR
jgi:hypothetical protein